MGILSRRRRVGAICGACGSANYKEVPLCDGEFKPRFECNNCHHTWNCGRTGGIYKELVKGEQK